jgi:hypothetical protein
MQLGQLEVIRELALCRSRVDDSQSAVHLVMPPLARRPTVAVADAYEGVCFEGGYA